MSNITTLTDAELDAVSGGFIIPVISVKVIGGNGGSAVSGIATGNNKGFVVKIGNGNTGGNSANGNISFNF
ncbi:class IIb bacteriocin, lactobin A/cerein 7B family [Paracraurococcus ruber]|uniref:Bacteriocin n=1 Tax=Paracraurococcus ruber TaxID=77675 RepID=A0ABS1D1W4_9PROT|nr:class IIb bacteriocin, lactobin A/cerein 7B family [Paracraurococcus ruber]MBK1660818.1 hypothetical protein [Paracraurococcus ruber]TDG27010.1 class IIb bacteriocin, lactobin A/cerein 7B family [Paracraurococcus ruber]